jgi:ABC-type glycerol-3-phosphate transport system substrate-binding protein
MRTRPSLAAGVVAAALVLSACGAVAAASAQPVHHASRFAVSQNQAVTNWTYVEDVAKAKQDVMQILAQRAGGR